jgi:allophanate hydrolase subunit 2
MSRGLSQRDSWVPTIPNPTTTVGYQGRTLQEGDELELPEAEGKRLVEAGVLVAAKAARWRSKK